MNMKRILPVLVLLFGFYSMNAQSTMDGSLSFGGATRTYKLHLPPGHGSGTQFPLVIFMHGLGDSGNGIMTGTGFNYTADTAGFIVVYPDAGDVPFFGPAWNNGTIPSIFTLPDDVGFISALIDDLAGSYDVDLERVYATGFSMGGIMAHHLGCELDNKVAAIASIAGTMAVSIEASCSPERAVPVMHIHGDVDTVVPYAGNPTLFLTSVDATLNTWVGEDMCPTTADTTAMPDIAMDGLTVDKIHYDPCVDGTEVLHYKVYGAYHNYFLTGFDINYNREIWNFFRGHDLNDGVAISREGLIDPGAIQAWPNPVFDYLNLEIEDTPIDQVEAFDLNGRLVHKQQDNLNKIDLQDLQGGFYFLKISSSKGQAMIRVLKAE